MSKESDFLITELIVKAEQCIMGQCFSSDVESARTALKTHVEALEEKAWKYDELCT